MHGQSLLFVSCHRTQNPEPLQAAVRDPRHEAGIRRRSFKQDRFDFARGVPGVPGVPGAIGALAVGKPCALG